MFLSTPSRLRLDSFAVRARSGDRTAEARLFQELHRRLLAIAHKRVRRDDVEDVVQEALAIVCSRYFRQRRSTPILLWATVTLRHVIGNYYRKRRVWADCVSFDEERHSWPILYGTDPDRRALQAEVASALGAIEDLSLRDPQAASLVRHLLESIDDRSCPRRIAMRALDSLQRDRPGVPRGTLHVAMYRSRRKLRSALRDRMRQCPPAPSREKEPFYRLASRR